MEEDTRGVVRLGMPCELSTVLRVSCYVEQRQSRVARPLFCKEALQGFDELDNENTESAN